MHMVEIQELDPLPERFFEPPVDNGKPEVEGFRARVLEGHEVGARWPVVEEYRSGEDFSVCRGEVGTEVSAPFSKKPLVSVDEEILPAVGEFRLAVDGEKIFDRGLRIDANISRFKGFPYGFAVTSGSSRPFFPVFGAEDGESRTGGVVVEPGEVVRQAVPAGSGGFAPPT